MNMKPSLTLLAIMVSAFASCGQTSVTDESRSWADVATSVEPSGPTSDDLPVRRKPRPSAFVPASPDTRSHEQLAMAACTGTPDAQHPDGWRCTGKRPVTFAASTGGSPILPVSWSVPNWFVNKSTGSDQNDCITALTACKTKQEIWVHRWGMVGSGSQNCPRFQQTTTLEQDVSDTDAIDPIYVCAASDNGASLVIKGGPVTGTAAVFTRSAQKNTAVGTNSLLAGSFSAGAPAANVLVTNTTVLKSSKAWIRKTAGGANWQLSQPMAPVTVPSASLIGAEVNTWATNDTVTLSTPIAINVVSASDVVNSFDGGFTTGVYLYNATLFDPQGAGNNTLYVGYGTHIIECASQRVPTFNEYAFSGTGATFISNTDLEVTILLSAGRPSGSVAIEGGIISGLQSGEGIALDNDVILQADPVLGTTSVITGEVSIQGSTFLGTNFIVDTSLIRMVGASTVVYGETTNTINMRGSSHFWLNTGSTFTAGFTAPGLVTGVLLNGTATGHSVNTTANVDTYCGAIATTPAKLDAAATTVCATTGFGGNAFNPGGASVANF
jgi:hypothetical protein